jgi:aspartate 1-decarboxylase
MRRILFKSKLHRATVTHADLDYEGSVTIDAELMRAADISPYEQVHIWDLTRGTRLITYATEGPAGAGEVCINGAAAHRVHPGDLVVIATFAAYDEAEVASHRPRIVPVDQGNRVVDRAATATGGPARRGSPGAD